MVMCHSKGVNGSFHNYNHVPDAIKRSRGKTFTVRVEIIIHWENFRGSMLCRLTLLIDQIIIHGKSFAIEWRTVKTTKHFPSNFLSYTVWDLEQM